MEDANTTDLELVHQTLRGDRKAYKRLIERYRNAVYGQALSFFTDFDLAEDLAQEAFIRGYYRLHTLKDPARFGGWLRTIVVNLCRMTHRQRNAIPVDAWNGDLDRIPSRAPSPDRIWERDEDHRRVLGALERLPQGEREAVALYYLDGESVAGVGRFLGISQSAVKVRLHRARHNLRKEMENMAKKTLSQKKLDKSFAERVELRAFTDLSRLTDEELKTLTSQGGTRTRRFPLAYALTGDDPEVSAIRARILDVLSEAEREMLQANMDFFNKYMTPLGEYRREVLSAAQQLQNDGAIRPAPKALEPKGAVEIQRFCDLAKLTDREMQMVLRETDTAWVAAALTGKIDLTGEDLEDIQAVKDKVFANVSERVGRFIQIEKKHHKASKQSIGNWQGHIVQVARSLQAQGVIRHGRDPMTQSRINIQRFDDLLNLTDYEIQALLRETDTKDFGIALNGRGQVFRDFEKRVMHNVSDRVGTMLREEIRFSKPSPGEIQNCQHKMIDSAKRLQVLGRIRPPLRKPTARQYEKAVVEIARDQLTRGQHSDSWNPQQYAQLMPYLAFVLRERGIDEAKMLFDCIDDPVFRRGLWALMSDVSDAELVQQLHKFASRELARKQRQYQKMIAGFAAVRQGKSPREIGETMA